MTNTGFEFLNEWWHLLIYFAMTAFVIYISERRPKKKV